jgi:hypothetical protein
MSGLEERVGLRVQGVELKLEALANELKRLSENLGDVEKDNQALLFLEPDIIKMLEAFWAREQEELNEGKEAVEGEGEADSKTKEADDEFNVIPINTPGGTSFKAHWVSISDSSIYSSCDQVDSKTKAEKLFLEVIGDKIDAGDKVSNGDLFFLLCNKPPPPEDEEQEYESCIYIGLYLDVESANQDAEPGSGTLTPGSDIITASEVEMVAPPADSVDAEAAYTAIRSVFVYEHCVCEGGEDPEPVALSVLVDGGGSPSASGYTISSTGNSSYSGGSVITGLGDVTVEKDIFMLAEPQKFGANASKLTLKPLSSITLKNETVDLFNNPCGVFKKGDVEEGSSNTVYTPGSGSSYNFNVLDGLTSGDKVSLGTQEDLKAFIPLLNQSDASNVEASVDSIVFVEDETTGLPITSVVEEENGVTTTTHTFHLAPQTHYSGITTQDSPTGFDIVTQTFEPDNGVGVDGSVTELEQVKITLEPHAEDASDSSAGMRYKLYRQYVTATNSYEKGRLKNFGNSVNQAKILLGEIVVPGTAAVYENLGIDGTLSLLGDYDVTMKSEFKEEESDGTKTAIHKIYKTKTTRANISWLDGILTGLGRDVKKENVLVGVIRVPEAPVAYGCDESYNCVEDPGGEYDEPSCGGGCPEPCTLEDPPENYYVYKYDQYTECWVLDSQHHIDTSGNVQNTDTTQHYSSYGRLDADCTYDPPELTFYVGNEPVIEAYNDTRLENEEIPEEMLCVDESELIFVKNVYAAHATLGNSVFAETVMLDSVRDYPVNLTVDFKTGVLIDRLKITGVGNTAGDTAVLLDTSPDNANRPVGQLLGDAGFNEKRYTIEMPADTQSLIIEVDHTNVEVVAGYEDDAPTYSDSGWQLAVYVQGTDVTDAKAAAWSGGVHDYPGRIVWQHAFYCKGKSEFISPCTGTRYCVRYELTGDFTVDGINFDINPNAEKVYFTDRCDCKAVDCPDWTY